MEMSPSKRHNLANGFVRKNLTTLNSDFQELLPRLFSRCAPARNIWGARQISEGQQQQGKVIKEKQKMMCQSTSLSSPSPGEREREREKDTCQLDREN